MKGKELNKADKRKSEKERVECDGREREKEGQKETVIERKCAKIQLNLISLILWHSLCQHVIET